MAYDLEAVLKETRNEAQGVKQVAHDLFQAESRERAECVRARERLVSMGEGMPGHRLSQACDIQPVEQVTEHGEVEHDG